MKRSSTKKGPEKGQERRKKPRSKSSRTASKSVSRAAKGPGKSSRLEEQCHHCGKDLEKSERALYVEEEIGRVFCAEECIAAYFTPEIERLEKEYFRRLSATDLSATEREGLSHLRWITLQEPDEVWREKTLSGDLRYTLISEFQPGNKKVWSVCICLFLRGEPSFLYLAFPTRSAAMANLYRRGERVEWVSPKQGERSGRLHGSDESDEEIQDEERSDRLASAWTDDETFRAQMMQERSSDDIPPEEFALYQGCMDETLEEPDEVWSMQPGGDEAPKLFHFIRHYPEERPGNWYVIVARETEAEDQIEILDSFPTRDRSLVERYRTGEQQVGGDASEVPAVTRLVH